MLIFQFSHLGSFLARLVLSAALVTVWLPLENAHSRPSPVLSTGINVTSLSDPGTGGCDLNECTLREAILFTNGDATEDWIKLAVNGTITLTSALPAITDDLTIDGSGRVLSVDGAGAFRVFSATAPITLTTLTIRNGLASGANGGGAFFGSTAVLSDVVVSNNIANAALAGGVFFAGPATVTASTFTGNRAGSAGGAYFQSAAVVSDTTFITNTATTGPGGGAYFEQSVTVTNSDFVDNSGGSAGGGALFRGTSILTNVSFVSNRSPAGYGGGAALGGTGSVVTDSLFEGNSANTDGGGLALADTGAGASVTLSANRIWHNSSQSGGAGLSLNAGTSASLDNNIFAANVLLTPASGTEIAVAGANSQLTGRHNTLASAAPASGTALSAGAGAIGQTVVLTNTIFDGYAVGVSAGPFSPTVVLDGVLWSSVSTPTQGTGITANYAVTGSAAFTNPLLRNYHLTGASAAIDTGQNTALSVDFEGDARSVGASGLLPDLGADEYLGVPPAPPSAIDDTATTPEDMPVTVNVLANDTDPNNDTLVVSAIGTPISGQVTLSSTIAIVYTPTLNFSGTDVFTYTVTDSTYTDTGTITITVSPINDAPTISDVSDITLTVGTSSGALPFSVGDVESGGALTVTAASGNLTLVPNLGLVVAGSGVSRTVTVTPAAGRAGQATITLTVSDNQAAIAQSSFVVVVYSRIHLPLINR